MKLINYKSKLDYGECEHFLKTIVVSNDNIGVNWIYSKNKYILLYYEDGTITRTGGFKLLKTFFYGKIKYKNNQVYLTGMIFIVSITTIGLVLSLLLSFCALINGAPTEFPVLCYLFLLVWFHIGERKNRKSIETYLHRVF